MYLIVTLKVLCDFYWSHEQNLVMVPKFIPYISVVIDSANCLTPLHEVDSNGGTYILHGILKYPQNK